VHPKSTARSTRRQAESPTSPQGRFTSAIGLFSRSCPEGLALRLGRSIHTQGDRGIPQVRAAYAADVPNCASHRPRERSKGLT
jgi:hypothetical protein